MNFNSFEKRLMIKRGLILNKEIEETLSVTPKTERTIKGHQR